MQKPIKFISRRGNIESDRERFTDYMGEALHGIDLYKIVKTFDRVIARQSDRSEYLFIYCLTDPRSLEPRYVGKSNDPKIRFNDHCSPRKRDFDSVKFQWIRELHAIGLRPLMQVLCKCLKSESENYEYRYFKLFNYDNNLLNSAIIQKETYQYNLVL